MMNNEILNKDISLLFPDGKSEDSLYSSKGLSDENSEQLELYTLLDLATLEIGASSKMFISFSMSV